MTPNQTDNVIVGYRNATDAQQQIIADLRAEITRLQSGGCARNQGATQFCAEAMENDERITKARDILSKIIWSHFYQSSCRGGEMERLMNQAIEILGGKQ